MSAFQRFSTAIVSVCLTACMGTSSDGGAALERERARVMVDSAAWRFASLFDGVILKDASMMEIVTGGTLTIDLQEALLDHGKPVVVKGTLSDIRKLNGGASYEVVFGPRTVQRPIQYHLVATQDQVDRLRALPRRNLGDGYVVVLSPSSLDRRPMSDEPSTEQEFYYGVRPPNGQAFLVAGTLLEFEYFEDMPFMSLKEGAFSDSTDG